ncbi:hypothetical protein PHAMO_180134 [Magnetospirillum molischianum DSM 120]|uniref:Uncharacterized protein n=1 Tax=Magnetospirillum molischianum DSM 120 TaxID=1150626 RepID=H8FP77_MAGML|nr:hypothetical protein PHAMO_180134 [Magnetospirillum molischianum DSM 120]
MINAKLADAVEEFGITEKTRLQTDDALSNSLLRPAVFKAIEPIAEHGGLANFDHV